MSSGQPNREFDETLFEFAPDAILVVDDTGRILKVNPQAQQLFGFSSGELEGELIERLIPNRYRAKHVGLRSSYVEAPHTRRMAAGLDLWACRKDGTEFAVEVALGPQRRIGQTKSGSGEGVLCIVRDITERRIAQQALQRAHDELERRVAARTEELSSANTKLSEYAKQLEISNRELQDFAYVASHDLQEPLRKIQAFGERLKDGLGPLLNEQMADYLARMQNAAGRMQTLINDLLTFSRVTTRAQPFKSISLDHILGEVLTDLELRIEETGAEVEAASLGTIEADPLQMRQLLQNLIGNALKFRDPTRSHKVAINARRFVTPGNPGEWFELTVEDNGIGFEPKYSEKIFGLFQRLHPRDEYAGSGVGLAICRKIAERHSGRITAVGNPRAGSIFTVVIPATHV